ncbi:calcium/sodium antiporter [Pseudovibrio exalbescens]|uniref:Sodium:calcium antiporter n=1 Tax=Pseudovibrio exalbescens TaxID=197461 RepID=A0A1U7JKZ5_9HYPH|nr:calcium/sodium antiporter [Pseudovibrio exalbescens]OKL45413.1 sodium:calcium antiporter [Pseudovibrio exalbescens]
MVILQLVGGLVLLLVGGEALVRGSVAVATRLGVSKLFIGLTLVGFGTSMPELVASLQGAFAGYPGVAVGNIVGSNITNVLLILGTSALIMPIVVNREAFRRDGAVLAFASLVLLAVVLSGALSRLAGLVLVGLLLAYTVCSFWVERRAKTAASAVHEAEADELSEPQLSVGWGVVLFFVGVGGIVFGADMLVSSSVDVAKRIGVSDAVIGLTLVAIGTSLPELVTSIVAAVRGHGDVAFGNVIGSNIFNIFGIGGVTALVVPIPVPAEIAGLDIWVMVGAVGLMAVACITGWRVSRREGLFFLACYGGYLALQLTPGLRAALGLA